VTLRVPRVGLAACGRGAAIVQSTAMVPGNIERGQLATPEDAVRLGGDAIAIASFIGGPGDASSLSGSLSAFGKQFGTVRHLSLPARFEHR
jgi:hypothetical protein